MVDSLTWWHRLRDPALARAVDELRREGVRHLTVLTGLVYLAWHIVSVPIDGGADEVMDHSLRHWALFAVVGAGLALTGRLLRSRPHLATAAFLLTSAASITMRLRAG